MKISLIVTTYERPDALAVVLRSIARQSLPPFEVIVADDGSGPETAEVVRDAAKRTDAIVHVWSGHDGFRAARMRNLALGKAGGDYIVSIDGDILLHRHFLADHAAVAERNHFVFGGRALLMPEATQKALDADEYWPFPWSAHVRKRHHLLRSRLLSRLFRGPNRFHYVKSCNMAFWRDDAFKVNGFNEDFIGWGAEDNEFAERLANGGVIGKALLYGALCCHLHHPPLTNANLGANLELLAKTRAAKSAWCENGLSSHNENVLGADAK